jgi:hypothetical protein
VAAVGMQVDVEEIQTTKSEKLLSVVLMAFLLVGGLWAYQRIDDGVRAAIGPAVPTAEDRLAVDRLAAASAGLFRAEGLEQRALVAMTVDREAYRTALDAGKPATALERTYERARAAYERAQTEVRAARDHVVAATPEADAARRRMATDEQAVARSEALASFGARLVLVLTAMTLGVGLLGRLRTRGSRYLPLGLAAVGFGTVLTLVMAGDYVTDYVDPLEFGPLVLAAVGVALTLLAFVALQRYLERRLPLHRVRKSECPFCGFPSGSGRHCEGCGRSVREDCTECAQPRRLGAPHCGTCGAV